MFKQFQQTQLAFFNISQVEENRCRSLAFTMPPRKRSHVVLRNSWKITCSQGAIEQPLLGHALDLLVVCIHLDVKIVCVTLGLSAEFCSCLARLKIEITILCFHGFRFSWAATYFSPRLKTLKASSTRGSSVLNVCPVRDEWHEICQQLMALRHW